MKTIEEWALSVAPHLTGWRFFSEHLTNSRPRFKHVGTGAVLFIIQDWQDSKKGNIKLVAGYQTSIGLSMSKSPKAAALDIQKRIADKAIELHIHQKQAQDVQQKKAELFDAVCKSFERIGFKSYHGRRSEAAYHSGNAEIEAFSSEPELWNMRLTKISPAKVFEIMAILEDKPQ